MSLIRKSEHEHTVNKKACPFRFFDRLSHDIMQNVLDYFDLFEAHYVAIIIGMSQYHNVSIYNLNAESISKYMRRPNYVRPCLWGVVISKVIKKIANTDDCPITHHTIEQLILISSEISTSVYAMEFIDAMYTIYIQRQQSGLSTETLDNVFNDMAIIRVGSSVALNFFKLNVAVHVTKRRVTLDEIVTFLLECYSKAGTSYKLILRLLKKLFQLYPENVALITHDILLARYDPCIRIYLASLRHDLFNDNFLIRAINLSKRLTRYIIEIYKPANESEMLNTCIINNFQYQNLDLMLKKGYTSNALNLSHPFINAFENTCKVLIKHKIKLPDNILDITNHSSRMAEVIMLLVDDLKYNPSSKALESAIIARNYTAINSYVKRFVEKKLPKTPEVVTCAIKEKSTVITSLLLNNGWPFDIPLVKIAFKFIDYDFEVTKFVIEWYNTSPIRAKKIIEMNEKKKMYSSIDYKGDRCPRFETSEIKLVDSVLIGEVFINGYLDLINYLVERKYCILKEKDYTSFMHRGIPDSALIIKNLLTKES